MAASYGKFNSDLIEDLRAHGGKVTSGPFKGRDVLILTSIGARSGETRENPLAFSRDGSHFIIVASKGGAPTNPHWYHNLRAHPLVTVEALGEKFEARAHFAEGDERERLYQQHADLFPSFHDYRQRTVRQIPVIVLEPVRES